MKPSELILNASGSIYHLDLFPEDIADTIFFVGDPDRVEKVSSRFDTIEVRKSKREFITHTGIFMGKRLTVISTGIGTDNIDIVLHELDALVNIDLQQRVVKPELTPLNIIRLGTSGAIHPDIDLGDVVVSSRAIGTDMLGSFYDGTACAIKGLPAWAYQTARYPFSLDRFAIPFHEGTTLTCAGFYAPQGRLLRISPSTLFEPQQLYTQNIDGFPITNLEMETSGIYLLASLMGHHAISFNLILAHRLEGNHHSDHEQSMADFIDAAISWAVQLPD